VEPSKEELLTQSQYRMLERLREAEERWRFALEGSGDGVWDWNLQSGETVLSKRWKEMIGYSEEEFDGQSGDWMAFIHPGDQDRVRDGLGKYLEGKIPQYIDEFRLSCKDGSLKWILARAMAVSRNIDGKPLRIIGTHSDITDRKRAEETIQRQAYYDELTQLPNRNLFRDRLQHEIKRMHRAGLKLALLFIDLDDFKQINDTLGHPAGDGLLAEAAQRISGCVRESDTVARFGGDVFAVILAGLDESDDVERVAQEINAGLTAPYRLGEENVVISASIGITLFPCDATDVDDLWKNADQAMYAAKNAGRGRFSFFTPAMQTAARARLRLINDMRLALENHQFEVYYQPIVNLSTGGIIKAEALIRWHHPERGMVSPVEFIPVAEDSGLIVAIGDFVLSQTARHLSRWRNQHDARLQISVNVSPVQFRTPGEPYAQIVSCLTEQGLPAESLSIEITEGLLLDTTSSISESLLQIRDAGVQVAIDDFGTGYSSLSYLRRFHIDYLKIDQSFVRNLASDPNDMAIAEAIIVMAQKLGLRVIAEGVETEAQRNLLAMAGCDYAQGYLFSRPVPANEFEALLMRG